MSRTSLVVVTLLSLAFLPAAAAQVAGGSAGGQQAGSAPPARVSVPIENCREREDCARVVEQVAAIPGVQNAACERTALNFEVLAGQRVSLQQIDAALAAATDDPENPIRSNPPRMELSGTIEIEVGNCPEDKLEAVMERLRSVRGLQMECPAPNQCRLVLERAVDVIRLEQPACQALDCTGTRNYREHHHITNITWTPPAEVQGAAPGAGTGGRSRP